MDNLGDSILKEAVYFLEICQEYVLNGKIQIKDYFSMSYIKLNFIRKLLDEEKNSLSLSSNLDLRIDNVFKTDAHIYNSISYVAN
ncbi:MAG: hypothetical protein Q8942_15275 [Bacillota bacterium]|nr:hypothetical protein [Bacillota bacterium]